MLKNGEVLPHRFAPHAGWVSYRLDKPEDLVNVRKIVQLAFENAKKNLEDVKSRRMQPRLE